MPAPFTFNTTEPAANSAPSASQPIMQLNNQSTSDLLAVDHITFNNDTGGTHQQVTYISPTAPSNPASASNIGIAYTKLGTADTANVQNFFINPVASFPLSAIKGFGSFLSGDDGAITPRNQYNVTSIAQLTVGSIVRWDITFSYNINNTYPTDNTCVFITLDEAFTYFSNLYQWQAANILRIKINSALSTLPLNVNFAVIQI